MASLTETVVYWLVDYYLAATALLALVCLVLSRTRQPARRMAVAWGGSVGLVVLAALCALPARPRIALLPSVSRAISNDGTTKADSSTATSRAGRPVAVPMNRRGVEAGDGEPDQANVVPIRPAGATDQVGAPAARAAAGQGGLLQSERDHVSEVAHSVDARTAVAASEPHGIWSGIVGRLRSMLRRDARMVVLAIFFTGCVLAAIRMLHGVFVATVLCRFATAAPSTVVAELNQVVGSRRRRPRLLMSTLYPVPIATGVVRPTILLPWSFADEKSARDCRSVLAHEWAHIHNGDLWLLALDRWLLLVLWAHPLYQWLRRTVRADQELLADASAAAHSSPVDYAEMLLNWARRIAAENTRRSAPTLSAPTAIGVWGRPSNLADRVSKLLQQSRGVELRCSRCWRLGSLAALASLPILLSTATVRPAAVPLAAAPLAVATSTAIGPALAQTAADEGTSDQQAQWEIEQPAIAEVQRLGGGVTTAAFGPLRLVTEVNMAYRFTPEGLRLDNSVFTDEALPHIAKFSNLKVLALTGRQTTDEGLGHVSGLSQLERVCLWDASSLTDAGTARLAALPRLKHLELSNARISDATIGRLGRVLTLEELSVQGCGLTGRSIALAAQFPILRSLVLDFGDNPLSAAALAPVAGMTTLEQLGLHGSALSDAVLPALFPLRNLRVLVLGEGGTTGGGLAALRRKLPNLYVVTPHQKYPAASSKRSAEECESSIRHSQGAVAVVRKFIKRLNAGSDAAAAQLICPESDATRQIADLRKLPAIANVDWNLAYADAKTVLAVSTEFTDAFGVEHVLVGTVKCTDEDWRIGSIAVTLARGGLEAKIDEFAEVHSTAHAGDGWLPLRARTP